MLIIGIILTVLGLIIFEWSANAENKSSLERPLIFNSVVAVFIINLLCIGLISSGLYSLWRVNPVIVLTILSIYAILWIFGYFLGSEKTKAKKIFNIYKQLKLFRPQTKKDEIFKKTARIYFKNLRFDEDRIDRIVNAIFEDSIGLKKDRNVKDVASSILFFENSYNNFGLDFNFESDLKTCSKRDKAIESAYKAVFGKNGEVIERPILSEAMLQRIKQMGLNAEEMSNEQLVAIESLENMGKSHWAAKIFSYLSYGLFILAIISLMVLEWGYLLVYSAGAFILGYIGNSIQMKVAGKQFVEASIKKFTVGNLLEKNHVGEYNKGEGINKMKNLK